MNKSEIKVGKTYKKGEVTMKIKAINQSGVVHAVDKDGKEHRHSMLQFAEWAESEVK